MRKVSDIWIATTIGFFSAFRDARKKGHELIRAGGQGGHLQPILSAVGQKRPLVVEIKGFKTGHFWEQKSAPLDLGRYGTRGASRTVEAPQSELPAAIYSLHDKGWSQRRIARELGLNRETVGRYLRLPKPAISTAGSTCGAKESMRTLRRNDPLQGGTGFKCTADLPGSSRREGLRRSPGTGGITRRTRTSCMKSDFVRLRVE